MSALSGAFDPRRAGYGLSDERFAGDGVQHVLEDKLVDLRNIPEAQGIADRQLQVPVARAQVGVRPGNLVLNPSSAARER